MSSESSRRVEKVGDKIGKGRGVVDRGRTSVERGKNICAGRGTKSRSDTTVL